MATGYTTSTTQITIARLSEFYSAGTPILLRQTAAPMIPDGGHESRESPPRSVGSHCAYCKRPRGEFPTCDGCGSTEFA